MAKSIAFFNNKGGVSKTTTCFNLGWMLANRGNRVVMVDADPQCNLTGMVLDLSEPDALDRFYQEHVEQNLKDALEPAFSSRPKPLEPVDCIEVSGCDRLFLVPGHVGLAEDEVSLGIAQQLSESVQALKNGSPGMIVGGDTRTRVRFGRFEPTSPACRPNARQTTGRPRRTHGKTAQ